MRTRHLKRELAVAADFRQRHGFASSFNLFTLTVASFARHFHGIRRTVHVMVGEFQVHDVITGFGRPVRNV